MPKTLRTNISKMLKGRDQVDNPALLFSRGLPEWPENATKRGEDLAKHIGKVAAQTVPAVYKKAFARWYDLFNNSSSCACWEGQVDGRLFLGLGGAHVLETNLTLSRPYGMPLIPGSSLKGLAHAHARSRGLDDNSCKALFGQGGSKPENDEAGYLLFHDAWWIPDSAKTPFAREVVTVHHPDYYGKKGDTPATDFDSPNPNAQLAARGSFLFVVEGAPSWAELGLVLLKDALQEVGIGGKVTAGYGYFMDDPTTAEQLKNDAEKRHENRRKQQEQAELATLPKEQQLRHKVANWDSRTIAEHFGKNWNKTQEEYAGDFDLLRQLVKEIHGAQIEQWAKSPNKNEEKAYKKLYRQEQ